MSDVSSYNEAGERALSSNLCGDVESRKISWSVSGVRKMMAVVMGPEDSRGSAMKLRNGRRALRSHL